MNAAEQLWASQKKAMTSFFRKVLTRKDTDLSMYQLGDKIELKALTHIQTHTQTNR